MQVQQGAVRAAVVQAFGLLVGGVKRMLLSLTVCMRASGPDWHVVTIGIVR